MSSAMTRMLEEDPTLRVHRETSTGEQIIVGAGRIARRDLPSSAWQRKFSVAVDVGRAEGGLSAKRSRLGDARQGRHVRQTGGHGQYGVVFLEIEPLERGGEFEFVDKVVGGVVPRNFIPAVEKGIREALDAGRARRVPGCRRAGGAGVTASTTRSTRSEAAFKTAGAIGFKAAMAEARPVLLEPVMDVEITVPGEFTGDIMGDLNTRRARVQGMNPLGGSTAVEAQVPQAEMLRYATELRSLTQGRGTYTMSFSHYEEVPAHTAQQIIAQRQKELAER